MAWHCPECGDLRGDATPLHGDDELMYCPDLDCTREVEWVAEFRIKKRTHRDWNHNPGTSQ